MRKRLALFVVICLFDCGIYGWERTTLSDRDAHIFVSQAMGGIAAKAADERENMTTVDDAESRETEKELQENIEDLDAPVTDAPSQNEVEREEDEPERAEKIEDDEDTDQDIQAQEDIYIEEEEHVENSQEDECIYNVSFPMDSKAYFDPENLSGRGQIFSDEFKVENYGNTDIAIKIKKIEVYYRSTEEVYELSETAVSDKASHVKKLNVEVVWKNEKENIEKVLNVVEGNPDEYVLELKASEYDKDGNFVKLSEGGTGFFYFTGTVNANPQLDWKNGEVKIVFDYEMLEVNEEKKEEDLQEDLTNSEGSM